MTRSERDHYEFIVVGLRTAGMDYGRIKEKVKHPKTGKAIFKSVDQVKEAFVRGLDKRQRGDDEIRRTNIERCESLIEAQWPNRSNPKSAAVILRAIQTQQVVAGLMGATMSGSSLPASLNAPALMPSQAYSNWATVSDLEDAAEIIDAEYTEVE